jgi:hypothetical protein
MSVHHHIQLPKDNGASGEREWLVDVTAAARVARWAARRPEVLEADLVGMATYFPHWLLAGGRCRRCATLLVPVDGAMRCIQCHRKRKANGLFWLGHIPALARPEPKFARRQAALRAAGFGEAHVGDATYLLVPLTVHYPDEWPNVKPVVRYAGRWLDALGLPRSNAAHHLIQNGKACLFAWGQWTAMPIHAVLQQRVVNHIASLLKVAAGRRPGEAFIGRAYHEPWHPEE